MRKEIIEHIGSLAAGKRFKNVLNIGAADCHKGEFPDLRTLIRCDKYIGIDLDETNPYVDQKMDARNLQFKDDSFDLVICAETLEHIDDIFKAASEIKRVLVKGGLLFISVPFILGFHDYPGDYWRITPAGMDFLFRGLQQKHLVLIGGGSEITPITIITIYANRNVTNLLCLQVSLKQAQKELLFITHS